MEILVPNEMEGYVGVLVVIYFWSIPADIECKSFQSYLMADYRINNLNTESISLVSSSLMSHQVNHAVLLLLLLELYCIILLRRCPLAIQEPNPSQISFSTFDIFIKPRNCLVERLLLGK